MRTFFRYVGFVLLGLLFIAACSLTYVKLALPNVGPAPDLKIGQTPGRIERGRYLANNVAVCMDCHSKRDFTKFSGPVTPGTLGMGGDRFDQSVGLPGIFYSANITPSGISRYTDGELLRVITTGVNKEGKALFPLMPYSYYGRMDTEDVYSIIAYIRTLAPLPNIVPASVPDFPMNIIIHMIPAKADPHKRPDAGDVLAYGEYLTNASGCRECHTPAENGQIILEKAFTGGRDFAFPDGSRVYSSNLTTDNETGIGKWTKDAFIQRFQIFADTSYSSVAVNRGEFNTIMPWTMYSKMTADDLGAIYTYLRTLPPVSNAVEKFRP